MTPEQHLRQHQMHTFIWMCILINFIWDGSDFSRDDVIDELEALGYSQDMIAQVCHIIDAVD